MSCFSVSRFFVTLCCSCLFERRLFLFRKGTCWCASLRIWLGYPLCFNAVKSLSETVLYVSSLEHALSSLVSSPLARLVKVPLGWAELYSRYWNLLGFFEVWF